MPKITGYEIDNLTVSDVTKAVASYDSGDRIWQPSLDKVAYYILLHGKKYPAVFIAATAIALKDNIKYKKGMKSSDTGGYTNQLLTKLKKLAFIIETDTTKKRRGRKVKDKVTTTAPLTSISPNLPNGIVLPTDRISEIFNDVNHQVVVLTPTKQEPSKSSLDPHLVEASKQLLKDGWRPS